MSHHKQQQQHQSNNRDSSPSPMRLFSFKREQDQPENLSKPVNNPCSSRGSSTPSPSPLSESSVTRNNRDDRACSEYNDDMAVDVDSADADGRQHDMDANCTDDFSVDTKYSGEEDRTNSPITNIEGLQDQPENLSNKSKRSIRNI